MSAVASAKRQASAVDDTPSEPVVSKKPKAAAELCAGVEAGTKMGDGDGKDAEEFRNYEDSDRHSVRSPGRQTDECLRARAARSLSPNGQTETH